MREDKTRRLVLMALLVALGTAVSQLNFPVAGARAYPIQATVDVLAGVMLGPGGAVIVAVVISALRNVLGLGTLLAFPGSIFGALLAGWFYRLSGADGLAAAGEVLGTGVVGAMVAFPAAALLLGRQAALFTYVLPFTLSSAAGAVLGYLLLKALRAARGLPADARRAKNP